jgi:hypothetical protein
VTEQRGIAPYYISMLVGAYLVFAACRGFVTGEAPKFLPLGFAAFEVLFGSLFDRKAGAFVGSGIMLILGGTFLAVGFKGVWNRNSP